MTLDDIFAGLSYGVFSNLAIGGEGSGMIPHEFEAKVIHHLNESLRTIYARFPMHEKEVQIRAYDGKALYPLKQIYADSDATTVPQKFITDTEEAPFIEDVLKVLSVYDNEGERISFNEDDEDCKVFTPTPTTIQLLEPVTGETYTVIYQAKHARLVSGDLSQAIELPDVLLPALYAHVAYQVMSNMNGQENAAKAGEHLAVYESACSEITDKDLVSTSVDSNPDKLRERGFV